MMRGERGREERERRREDQERGENGMESHVLCVRHHHHIPIKDINTYLLISGEDTTDWFSICGRQLILRCVIESPHLMIQ